MAALPLLLRAQRGDGHPVIVLPGFMSSDAATAPLRAYLGAMGYRVIPWGLGTNVGPTKRAIDGCGDLLVSAAGAHGGTVSLIGWSLGGIYAHEMARKHPHLVRQVITLGSPIHLAHGSQTHVSWLFGLYSRLHVDPSTLPEAPAAGSPLPVPTTSIYSRSDGVVRWHTCLTVAGPTAENVAVRGSHCGLGFNVAATWAIADRLAQPDGSWEPFQPGPRMRRFFPPAASWLPGP